MNLLTLTKFNQQVDLIRATLNVLPQFSTRNLTNQFKQVCKDNL